MNRVSSSTTRPASRIFVFCRLQAKVGALLAHTRQPNKWAVAESSRKRKVEAECELVNFFIVKVIGDMVVFDSSNAGI